MSELEKKLYVGGVEIKPVESWKLDTRPLGMRIRELFNVEIPFRLWQFFHGYVLRGNTWVKRREANR